MKLRDFFLALLCVSIWGANATAVKIAITEIPPIFLTALRFLIVGIVVLPFSKPSKSDLKAICLLSLVMGVGHFGLWFYALTGIEASTAAVVIQTGAPISALISAILFKDKIGSITAFGISVCFVGVIVIAGEPNLESPAHLLILLLSATGWAFGNIIIKFIKKSSSIAINGGMAFFASVQLFLISFLMEQNQLLAIKNATIKGWGGLAFTVFGASLIGYTVWYNLISKYDISKVVFFSLLAPVAGLITGFLVLSEALTIHKIFGAILIISGIAIIEVRKLQKSRRGKIETNS